MDVLIDDISTLKDKLDTLTFEQVNMKYGTGRSNTVTTPQGKKSFYRHGVMTEIGDIRESVWMEIVEYLIVRDKETELYNCLYEWVKDTYGWNQTDAERKQYVLQLHATRIFDNPAWVDYIAFNEKYHIRKKQLDFA